MREFICQPWICRVFPFTWRRSTIALNCQSCCLSKTLLQCFGKHFIPEYVIPSPPQAKNPTGVLFQSMLPFDKFKIGHFGAEWMPDVPDSVDFPNQRLYNKKNVFFLHLNLPFDKFKIGHFGAEGKLDVPDSVDFPNQRLWYFFRFFLFSFVDFFHIWSWYLTNSK